MLRARLLWLWRQGRYHPAARLAAPGAPRGAVQRVRPHVRRHDQDRHLRHPQGRSRPALRLGRSGLVGPYGHGLRIRSRRSWVSSTPSTSTTSSACWPITPSRTSASSLLGVGASMTAHGAGQLGRHRRCSRSDGRPLPHAQPRDVQGRAVPRRGLPCSTATGTRNMEKMGGLFRRMPVNGRLLPHRRACHLGHPAASTASCPSGSPTSPCLTSSTLADPVVMVVRRRLRGRRARHHRRPGRHVLREGLRRLVRRRSPRSQEAAANAKEVPGSDGVLRRCLLAAICVVLGIGSPGHRARFWATSPQSVLASAPAASQPPRACVLW